MGGDEMGWRRHMAASEIEDGRRGLPGKKMAGDSGGQVVVHALYRHTHTRGQNGY
jgi:hypothetical protein